jgi:hypothetical protein
MAKLRLKIVMICSVLISPPMICASQSTCGIMTIDYGNSLSYPKMAWAAHVTGSVATMVIFNPDGTVLSERVLSGPDMLKGSTLDSIKTWKASPEGGPRECLIEVTYDLSSTTPVCTYDESKALIEHPDVQHVTIRQQAVWTCDPSSTIVRIRHRFLFFHWYTKAT